MGDRWGAIFGETTDTQDNGSLKVSWKPNYKLKADELEIVTSVPRIQVAMHHGFDCHLKTFLQSAPHYDFGGVLELDMVRACP